MMTIIRPAWVLMMALGLGSGCGDDDGGAPDATLGAASDATPDAGSDATPDATLDATPDAALDLTLRTAWGSEETLEVVTDGIYAIWWDPRFDHAADAVAMFDQLHRIRRECLDELGMADPPNPAAGYYYNVYIHHGEDDDFPAEWVNGQGTDRFGMPYLALPNGAHIEEANLYHEGFHIFQYEATSPGFEYRGDSQWYIESTAQWFMAKHLPMQEDAYVEIGALSGNPQLALWHSFTNEAPGDPRDWLFQVRQYGMHAYLVYLTEEAGVDPDIITRGFYEGTELSPQRYHYDAIGGDALRGYFADWAAHNTAGFDYLTPAQVARAIREVEVVGDPANLHPFVGNFTDEGTGTEAFRPDASLTPRGWAYNVIRIANTRAATYAVSLVGDEVGGSGAAAHFEGRIVVMGSSGPRYSSLSMTDARSGAASVTVTASEAEIFIIIASVPESFTGTQTYGYSLRVGRSE